jgi:hypothetical protein
MRIARKFIKAAIILIILGLILICCSCGNNPAPATPISYDGVWKSTGNPEMIATIKDHNIEIIWNMDNDTKGLYWAGTFPGTASTLTETIISKADTKALDSSLIGSQNDTKTFLYKDGVLSFEFKIMGTYQQISLKK